MFVAVPRVDARARRSDSRAGVHGLPRARALWVRGPSTARGGESGCARLRVLRLGQPRALLLRQLRSVFSR